MKKAIYIVVIAILIVAFCVSAFMVGRYLLEGKKQADLYDDLVDIKNQAQTAPPTTAAPTQAGTTETTKPGFEVATDPTVEGGISPYASCYGGLYISRNDLRNSDGDRKSVV